MKRILFLSRDPGGTNCLIPVIKALHDEAECVVYGKEMAVPLYEAAGIACKKADSMGYADEEEYTAQLLDSIHPDVVVTGTSSDDFIERIMWLCCASREIKSVAILDAWVNYVVRFSEYRVQDFDIVGMRICCHPDHVLVMDDCASSEMIKAGHLPEYVTVTGQPYLEYMYQKYSAVSQQAIDGYRSRLGIGNKKIILYISDNLSSSFPVEGKPYWGYDEKITYENLMQAIKDCGHDTSGYALVVRPHPKEDMGYWRNIQESSELTIYIDDAVDGAVSVMSCELAVGMFSMMLTEAAIAGKRIMSVQLNAKRDPGFFLGQRGFIRPFFDYDSLVAGLDKFFTDNNAIKPLLLGNYFRGSIDRTADFIKNV